MAEKKKLWDSEIVSKAIVDSFRKLDPRGMVKNPVMFVVEVGSVLTSLLLIDNAVHHRAGFGFNVQITLWLWFTVMFANFAEAMAEGRGKAQADSLRKAKGETIAYRYRQDGTMRPAQLRSPLRRHHPRRGRAVHSRRRRSHRGHRIGGRVCDHRRVGSGAPRIRR